MQKPPVRHHEAPGRTMSESSTSPVEHPSWHGTAAAPPTICRTAIDGGTLARGFTVPASLSEKNGRHAPAACTRASRHHRSSDPSAEQEGRAADALMIALCRRFPPPVPISKYEQESITEIKGWSPQVRPHLLSKGKRTRTGHAGTDPPVEAN